MTAKFSFEVTKSWQFSEKLFTKAATGGVLQHRCFPVKFAKRLRTPILNPFWRTSASDCYYI